MSLSSLLSGIVCVSLFTSPWLVAAEGAEITRAELAFGGAAKHGHWAEVNVVVTAIDAPVDCELSIASRDGDGVPTRTLSPGRLRIAPGGSAEAKVLVKVGPPPFDMQAKLEIDGEVVAEKPVALRSGLQIHASTCEVFTMLGGSLPLQDATRQLQRQRPDQQFAVVELEQTRELPEVWEGYDAIDCLVVTAANENPLADLSTAQRSALLNWIRFGGRLVLVPSEATIEIFATGSDFSKLLPGEMLTSDRLASDTGLRAFTGEALEIDRGDVPAPTLLRVETSRQNVLVWEGAATESERAVVLDHPLGMGRVSIVLVDIASPPFTTWAGRPRLLARILSGEKIGQELRESSSAGGRMTRLGYDDLAGQFRSSLDHYPQAIAVHFYVVAGALFIYLLLLGPGEYFLLKRVAPLSMHLTWLLFPLIVTLFVGGSIANSVANRARGLQVNKVDLVDVDMVDGSLRGTFWAAIYSSSGEELSLTAKPRVPLPDAAIRETLFSWQGLPGLGLGGVDRPPLAAVATEPYTILPGAGSEPSRLDRVPISVASSKILSGNWWGTFAPPKNASRLSKNRLRNLEGSFQNIAPVALQNAFLVHGESMYRIRNELAPGATVRIDRLERKHLEIQLTQRRALESHDVASPWDQEETDVSRILQIMMFHGAVRGRDYTVLSHRYHPEIDFSYLIQHNNAVLVGRASTPVVSIEHAGEEIASDPAREWTYYRIIFPVDNAPAAAPPTVDE